MWFNWPMAPTCTTCNRPANAPARRIVDGRIVEGCVDAAHTGHLIVPSDSAEWHNRPEAKAIRASVKRHGYWGPRGH